MLLTCKFGYVYVKRNYTYESKSGAHLTCKQSKQFKLLGVCVGFIHFYRIYYIYFKLVIWHNYGWLLLMISFNNTISFIIVQLPLLHSFSRCYGNQLRSRLLIILPLPYDSTGKMFIHVFWRRDLSTSMFIANYYKTHPIHFRSTHFNVRSFVRSTHIVRAIEINYDNK